MPVTPIEFFFDLVSPYSHFAAHRASALAETTGRPVLWRPFFLGGVMRSSGNTPPAAVPNKARFLLADFARESARLKIPFSFNPAFPMNTLGVMRALAGLELREPERLPELVPALFTATWVDNVAADDLTAFAPVLAAHELDPASFAASAADPANKQRLLANSEEAVSRGAFGAPTFFVGEQLWWGHDRMEQLAFGLAQDRA